MLPPYFRFDSPFSGWEFFLLFPTEHRVWYPKTIYIYIFYSTQLNKGLDSLPISAFFKISIGICRIHEFHFTSKEDLWLKSNHVPFRVRQWACCNIAEWFSFVFLISPSFKCTLGNRIICGAISAESLMGGNTIWYSLHKKHSLRLSLTIESTFVSNVFNEALKAILQKVTKCIFFLFINLIWCSHRVVPALILFLVHSILVSHN